MASQKPKYIDSPYYVSKPGGGYFKDGAPEELIKEFEEFQAYDEAHEAADVPKLKASDLE